MKSSILQHCLDPEGCLDVFLVLFDCLGCRISGEGVAKLFSENICEDFQDTSQAPFASNSSPLG